MAEYRPLPRGKGLPDSETRLYADFSLRGRCCEKKADPVSSGLVYRELVFDTGLGHGLFYGPNPQWVSPVLDWLNPYLSMGFGIPIASNSPPA